MKLGRSLVKIEADFEPMNTLNGEIEEISRINERLKMCWLNSVSTVSWRNCKLVKTLV